MGDEITENKKTKMRSPNYPVIDLEKAVERIRELYGKDKMHPVSITLLHDRWGLKKMSGVLQQTVAALKSYGLVEVSGMGDKRNVSVSEIGRKILFDHVDKDSLVKQSALKPKIFAHLWEKYAAEGLPQDDVIAHYLIFDFETPFNEDVVSDVIARFRNTILYAKLGSNDIITSGETDPHGEIGGNDGGDVQPNTKGQYQSPPLPKPVGIMKNFSFPLIGGDVATLQVPHPMSEENYAVLLAVLGAIKVSLTTAPKTENPPSE